MPESARRALVNLCNAHDLTLVEDDIYGDLQFEGPRPLPCKAFDTVRV